MKFLATYEDDDIHVQCDVHVFAWLVSYIAQENPIIGSIQFFAQKIIEFFLDDRHAKRY